jgi:uncharacterized protein
LESTPKIAIVGFSARAAAQCAKRQGFEVIAVDFCSDRDLLSDCQQHYHLQDPNWHVAFNATHPTVPILLTGGMENRIHLIEKCESSALKSGPNAIQLQAMRSLDNWAAWAVACDLGWPVTLTDAGEIQRVDEMFPSREWIAKPFSGAGGNGIVEWTSREDRDRALGSEPTTGYVQQRLPGESIGVTFLSSNVGSTIVGATASWKSEASFVGGPIYAYRGSYGPISLTCEQIERLQRFATLVGIETGLVGLWQADFLLHQGELTLLEINPRWSASMDILDVCLSIPLIRFHRACICDSLSVEQFLQVASECYGQAMSSRKSMLGKLIVYAPRSCVITPLQSERWWSQRWTSDMNCGATPYQFADIPNPSTTVSVGDPLLTVMASGGSPEVIMAALQRGKTASLDDRSGCGG